MSAANGRIGVRHDDGISWLTLDRPRNANSVDLEMAQAFAAAISEVAALGSRSIVMTGSGPAFCAGGDVAAMGRAPDPSAFLTELAGTFHEGLRRLSALDAVIIAAVNGVAAGAGLGLVLHADVVIASESARFITAYDAVGLTPDSGVSYLLPRSIGMHRALEMSATGVALDAGAARRAGLVSEVVAPDLLLTAAHNVAMRARARPQDHMAGTRRLMRGADTYDARLDDEARTIAAAGGTDTAAARIRAFASRHRKDDDA